MDKDIVTFSCKSLSVSPCREQCTRVSSRSSTRVNWGLDLVFRGRAGFLCLISGVNGGSILIKR